MAQTTWKQVVLDTADAIREANGTTAKIAIGDLPNKVKEGGENIDTELTTLESTLQEILEVLPFKGFQNSGQYVWKKYSNSLTFENPTITITDGGMGVVWKVSGVDGLDSVNESFFDGFAYGNYVFSYANGVLTGSDGSTTRTFTYAPATQQLTGSSSNPFGTYKSPFNMTYTGTKVINVQKGDFIDYVVSSDTEAYPNGAVHTDGYWYELTEGFEFGVEFANVMGLRKFAIDTFSFSSKTRVDTPVNHSLGTIPKFALMLAKGSVTENGCLLSHIGASMVEVTTGLINTALMLYRNTSVAQQVSTVASGFDVTTAQIWVDPTGYYFQAGVEYMVITGA